MNDNSNSSIFEIIWPDHKSELTMVPGLIINFPDEMPNWWWRFWQRVFFGFKWRSLVTDDE